MRGALLCIGQDTCVEIIDSRGPPSDWAGFASSRASACVRLALEVHRRPCPPLGPLELVFDSEGLWTLSRAGRLDVFDLPGLRAVVDFGAGQGHIHVHEPDREAFAYPLDEVLFSRLLAERGAVIVHACGVALGDRALLLAGESGAGKSTLAKLLEGQRGASVLGDDRIALEASEAGVRIWGTPWRGTAGLCRDRSTSLAQILFIRHADALRQRHLSGVEAASRLLALSALPYWDRVATGRAADGVLDVISRVPASDLGFTPGPEAAGFLLDCLMDS